MLFRDSWLVREKRYDSLQRMRTALRFINGDSVILCSRTSTTVEPCVNFVIIGLRNDQLCQHYVQRSYATMIATGIISFIQREAMSASILCSMYMRLKSGLFCSPANASASLFPLLVPFPCAYFAFLVPIEALLACLPSQTVST